LLLFGNDHLHGIGTGTDDVTDLGNGLDCGEDVDRERAVEEDDKRVPGADALSVLHCKAGERLIRPRFVLRYDSASSVSLVQHPFVSFPPGKSGQ